MSPETQEPSSSSKWRTQFKQSQLISQISCTLLQRRNWAPILRTLNLSSQINSSIFLHILQKTQSNPQISLTFFNWAKTKLGFEPDLRVLTKLTRVLIGSGFFRQSKPVLDSLIQTYPTAQIVDATVRACEGTNFHSPVLGSVLECYCHKGLLSQALEVYRKSIKHGCFLSVRSCNKLLDELQLRNDVRFSWCLYAHMLRHGFVPDRSTWSVVAWILCKDGKFEAAVRISDMGVRNIEIYNLIIDGYSKRGNFRDSFELLDHMRSRKLEPSFGTYSSILDGACRFGDAAVIQMVLGDMGDKGLLPDSLLSECDSLIQKLSDLGRTYALDMILKKACVEKVELGNGSYGQLLSAFSKAGRLREAIEIYRLVLARNVDVNESYCNAFANVLCQEDPSDEISGLLKDLLMKGYSPCEAKLSMFISSQCAKRRWREAEELVNVAVEKELLRDYSCCSSLVKHYCDSRRIDTAVALHKKVEKLESSFDVSTYNMLLYGLLKERRVNEAVEVFDYMRSRKLLSSASFTTMVRLLCQDNNLREAMKLHDEMLKLGLKPDNKTYRSLISNFK